MTIHQVFETEAVVTDEMPFLSLNLSSIQSYFLGIHFIHETYTIIFVVILLLRITLSLCCEDMSNYRYHRPWQRCISFMHCTTVYGYYSKVSN